MRHPLRVNRKGEDLEKENRKEIRRISKPGIEE